MFFFTVHNRGEKKIDLTTDPSLSDYWIFTTDGGLFEFILVVNLNIYICDKN